MADKVNINIRIIKPNGENIPLGFVWDGQRFQGGRKFVPAGGVVAPPFINNTSFEFFQASSQRLNGGNIHDFSMFSPFSFSIWINPSSLGTGFGGVLSKRVDGAAGPTGFLGYAMLYQYSTQSIRMQFFNPTTGFNKIVGTPALSVPSDTFSYVTFTNDGSGTVGGMNFHVDSIPQTPTIIVNTPGAGDITNPANFVIGSGNAGAGNFYEGLQDEFTPWGILLSLPQIQTIFNSGKPQDISSLAFFNITDTKAWYRMESPPDDATGGTGVVTDVVNGLNLVPENTVPGNIVALVA